MRIYRAVAAVALVAMTGLLPGCAAIAVGGAVVSTAASGVTTVASTAVGVTTSAAGAAVDVVTPGAKEPPRP